MYGKAEIIDFEEYLSSVKAKDYPKILGLAYTTYIEYKNDKRPINKQRVAPTYVLYSIEAHKLLKKSDLNSLMEKRLSPDSYKSMTAKDFCEEFEDVMAFGPSAAAGLLGLSLSSYAQLRGSDKKQISKYHVFHYQALRSLNNYHFRSLLDNRLDINKLKNYSRSNIALIREACERLLSDLALSNLLGVSESDITSASLGKEVMSHELDAAISIHSLLSREHLTELSISRKKENNQESLVNLLKQQSSLYKLSLVEFAQVFLGISGRNGYQASMSNTVKYSLEALSLLEVSVVQQKYRL